MEIIIQNHCGTTTLQADDAFAVPDELNVIYAFSQLDMPDDLNMKASHWSKIETYIAKFCPDHDQEAYIMLHKIQSYKRQSRLKKLIYMSNLLYKPSEIVMQMLILKAALD